MRLRTTTVALAATALTFTGPAALADLFANDLDDSVDTTHELMLLQYDSQGTSSPADDVRGATVSTSIRMVIDGAFVAGADKDHPNCDINGGSHYAELAADVSEPGVVELAYPDGLRFEDCDDVLHVRVTPLGVGDATVQFSVQSSKTSHPVTLTTAGADFDVRVNETDLDPEEPGTGLKCDRNPAAPAWANAILRANEVKLRGDDRRDVLGSVARRMETAASFPDDDVSGHLVAKIADDYPDEVHEYMVEQLGLELPKDADDVDRPARVCTTVTR